MSHALAKSIHLPVVAATKPVQAYILPRSGRLAYSATPTHAPAKAPANTSHETKSSELGNQAPGEQPRKKKTVAELDEELRQKLEARSGDGGEAGLELEGGKPVAMKRGVKENMFRLI
ncbi:MAG: hypothetical protein LQ340_006041 [Diploschistes diacapsis]|nr:MAG: hypothetical protein LQ340_006041 [Diploschistes diacapsis]